MFFEDFSLHMAADIAPTEIEKEKMVEFARLYDPLPLHMDEEYAKTTRFGGLIAPGVMSFMSVWAKYLDLNWFGDELVAGKSTKIEWLKPVFPGDVLRGRVEITALQERNAKNGLVEVTITAYNQHGEAVLTDVTEAIVLRRR